MSDPSDSHWISVISERHLVLNQPCGQCLSILTSGVGLHIFKPNPRCSSVLGKAQLPVLQTVKGTLHVSWAPPGGSFPPHVAWHVISTVADVCVHRAFTHAHVFTYRLLHTHTHAHQLLKETRTGSLLGHQHELLLRVQRAKSPQTLLGSRKVIHSRVKRGLLAELVFAPPDADRARRQEEQKTLARGETVIASLLGIHPLLCVFRTLGECVHWRTDSAEDRGRGLQPQSIKEALGSKDE